MSKGVLTVNACRLFNVGEWSVERDTEGVVRSLIKAVNRHLPGVLTPRKPAVWVTGAVTENYLDRYRCCNLLGVTLLTGAVTSCITRRGGKAPPISLCPLSGAQIVCLLITDDNE
jgi:hypothetical protein